MDAMTFARARLTMLGAVRNWLFDPNVSLIGLGWKERDGQIIEDRLVIRFHVRQKLSGFQLQSANTQPIPPRLDDIETDVPEGNYRLHAWWGQGWGWGWSSANPRAKRVDPMQCGISIGNERQFNYGTLGALVADRTTGDRMCLSNWHVLVGDWGWRQGQRIYQPGRGDGGTSVDTIANLTRDAMWANFDAAVAKLTGSRALINNQFDLGAVKGFCSAILGMEVVKSGRQSKVTYGRVTDIEAVTTLPYNGLNRIIREVIVIDQRSPFEEVSAGGDSGSLWLDSGNMCAVGLHFAGQDRPTKRALAIDIKSILDALDVDLVT